MFGTNPNKISHIKLLSLFKPLIFVYLLIIVIICFFTVKIIDMSSFFYGLLVGCISGAIGYSYVQKFTFNRGQLAKGKNHRDEINLLFEQYPDFMSHVKNNINDPEFKNIREFFVIDKSALMNSSIPRLRYDLSDEILPVLNKLEEAAYIEKLPNDSLLYKMNEHFISQVRAFNYPEIL